MNTGIAEVTVITGRPARPMSPKVAPTPRTTVRVGPTTPPTERRVMRSMRTTTPRARGLRSPRSWWIRFPISVVRTGSPAMTARRSRPDATSCSSTMRRTSTRRASFSSTSMLMSTLSRIAGTWPSLDTTMPLYTGHASRRSTRWATEASPMGPSSTRGTGRRVVPRTSMVSAVVTLRTSSYRAVRASVRARVRVRVAGVRPSSPSSATTMASAAPKTSSTSSHQLSTG